MASHLKRAAGTFAAEQKIWEFHRKILLARGVDPIKWAAKQVDRLTSPDACTSFAELSVHHCTPIVIAAILALLRYSPFLQGIWTQIVGDSKKRKKVSRSLMKTASLIEASFCDLISLEDDDARGAYRDFGRIPLSELVSELKFYNEYVDMAKQLSVDTETRSIRDFLKYLLVAYVRRATGTFHDRQVSALLADVTGHEDYNEVAQRMWRSRNYKRMEKHFSKFADFLLAMDIVISRTT
jgi:hypothetical protein